MKIKPVSELDLYQVVKDTVSEDSILDIMFKKELMTRKLFSHYNRGQVMSEEPFENPPTYMKHAYDTDKKTHLYKIRGGNTVKFEYVARDSGISYQTILAHIYLVPQDYKHLHYKEVEQKILDIIFPGCTTYNSIPFYHKRNEHTIYLDPAIIFDRSKRTKAYVIEFFKKYNFHSSTHEAIDYLEKNWKDYQLVLDGIEEHKTLILDKIEKPNKHTTVLLHRIEYRHDEEDIELTETDIEHIEQQIKNECSQGELCTSTEDKDIYGRWKIVKD